MQGYINCIAHETSDGNLLLGEERTALFDCGMIFCAQDTIARVKAALRGRPLDYIFATHTHYDHIGALPFFRREWPQLRLAAAALSAQFLLRPTPRRVIRELSKTAAAAFAPDRVRLCDEYDDEAFRADVIVAHGDTLPLGGVSVEVIEAPGHTRDSLMFLVPEKRLLIVNETPGVLGADGVLYPTYLTSFSDALDCVRRCGRLAFDHISSPHRGIVGGGYAARFPAQAERSLTECRDFILSRHRGGDSEAEILEAFVARYAAPALLAVEPEYALRINAAAAIASTLREFA